MAAFSSGSVVVYRVGTGSGPLQNTGNAVFLDEYSATGSLIQSIALPTAASGANLPLVASGTATSEGFMSLSADGRYLLLTGYGSTLPAGGSLSATSGTAVPRVIGRVDGAGTVDTSTALTDYAGGNNPRSAASSDGIDLWATGGTGGVRSTAFDGDAATDTSVQLNTDTLNLRQINVFDGQLYVSSASGALRLGAVGTGLPTTPGQTITGLPGITTTTTPSPYGFYLADLSSAVAGLDTLYVADDATGLLKYSLVGGTWAANGAVGSDADDYRGLTASVSGSTVTLFATRKGGGSATGGGELVGLTDASGYGGTLAGTPTLLATATANEAFRGVALAPAAAAPADVTPPVLTASSPADGATGVGAGQSIVLTFGEAVVAGTGDITITNGAGDTRVIAVTDAAQVTVSGTNVTINPSADLGTGSTYGVLVPGSAFTDASGNPFVGTQNAVPGLEAGELDFTTAAATASAVINGVTLYAAAPSLQGLQGATATTPPTATNALQLVRLGAYATTDDTATTARPNAEVVAYDKTTSTVYVQNTNEGRIEIVALSASGALTKTGEIDLRSLAGFGSVNSVAVDHGIVAVAYANAAGDQPGRVALFDAAGTLRTLLDVGIGPDQLTFTPDGTKILVANEAESAGTLASPIQTAAGISIIDVSGGAAAATVRNTIGFAALDGSEATLRANGLAITPGNTAANDIEPEYISVSPDGTRAYVTLQEVNGVAIIDITDPAATKPLAIVPLGAVNHALAGNEFDASDRDGAGGTASIRIAASPTPIYGLLQPDSIASFTANGATYFVTANEGDQRVVGGVDDPADVARLSAVPNAQLTPALQALKADPAYARLNVLLRTGDTDGDGIIDQLATLGGRSISIFRQNDDGSVTKVRETGGEFEKIFAALAPGRFNNDQVIGATPDDRSDNKGPEPEGITTGTIDGRTYAFVGLERQSGVLVYDVTDPETASFVSYVPPLAGSAADLGPEVLKFIAAADNPTGTPLVITASEVSGQTVPGSNPAVISNGGATLYAALPAGFTQDLHFVPGSLAVSRAEGAPGASTTYTFTVERSNGTLGDLTFTASVAGSGATAADAADFGGTLPATVNGTIAAGQSTTTVSVTVAGDAADERDETFSLSLGNAANSQSGIGAAVSGTAGVATGTIANDDATPISAIQGAGARSAFAGAGGDTNAGAAGGTVTVDAIVVGDFQNGDADGKRNLNGFFLQEQAADQDGNPLTSEGLFVFQGNVPGAVAVGDHVRVTGTVSEYFGFTELTAQSIQIVAAAEVADVRSLAVDVALPTASTTLSQNGIAQPDLERYEGMIVRLPQTLTISEQFNLDRFNEIRLAAGGRPETFTNAFEPGTAAYAAYLQQVGARSIVYDDGLNVQNAAIENLDGYDPYGTAVAHRVGDTIGNLTGVLDYEFAGNAASGATWRVRSVQDGSNTFTAANPRTEAPDPVGGTLKVAGFNVLNYFRTLDTSASATTAIGLEPRGANTVAELDRQSEKLTNFILDLNADVLGLTELENQFRPGDPGNAIQSLVAQLNAKTAPGTYAYADPGAQLDNGQFLGGDAIAVGFIYRPGTVRIAPGTTVQKLDDADVRADLLAESTAKDANGAGHIFNGLNTSRAALGVTFQEIATGESFTAVVNHLKSKSGIGTGADADQGDGQGAWQQQRELAATALSEWIATRPTGTTDTDVLLLGDFNAYLKEDALDIIKAGGFTNLAEARLADPYSYVFDGQFGALDHAFASASLDRQVTGVTEWHVNADEADAIDYNLDFGRDPSYFDGATPSRESDHDPILVGLRLDQTAPLLRAATPADDATRISAAANIVLTFNEAVTAGSGSIVISNGAGDTRVIAVTDASQVTIGGASVTINPTADLARGSAYDVVIPAGALTDAAGNPFAGIAQNQLDFTTETAPVANYTLQLLHISDSEGSTLTPSTAPILGALVDRFDDQYANTFVLAGGDDFIPGPFLNAGADPSLNAVVGGTTALGRPDIAILNALGVATSAIGNHEFDLGSAVLNGAYAPAAGWVGAQFPYLAANLDFSGDSFLRSTVVAGGQEASSIRGKIAPSAIITKGGEKIGVVGATTQVLERISSPTGTEVNGFPKIGQAGDNTTEVDDMAALAAQLQPVIDGLIAQGVNKVILTSHLQLLSNEQALAPLLRGVDIILAAGSHTRMGDATDVAAAFPGHDATFQATYPIVTAGADGAPTVIVSTDSESTYLGRLVVDFDANGRLVTSSLNPAIDGAYASNQATLQAVYGADIGQAFATGSIGQKVKTITDAVSNVVAAKDGTLYGYTGVYLEGDRVFGRSEEVNLGNISADANTAALRSIDPGQTFVVSLKNGGGIRASIGSVSDGSNNTAAGLKLPPAANPAASKPAGAISQLESENALRFDNKLMVFDTTAQGLVNILNYGASLAPGNGGFPQIGGVHLSYDRSVPGALKLQNVALYDENDRFVASILKNGVLDPSAPAKISVVTLNFTANGGDGYPVKQNGDNFRFLLQDGKLSAAVDEALDFTTVTPANALGELKAFQDYTKALYPTAEKAYAVPDTPASLDLRIENLAVRGDAVFNDLFGDVVRDTGSNDGKVYNLYDAILTRTPDALGQAFWSDALESGRGLKDVAQGLLNSSEWAAKHGSLASLGDAAYLDQLYSAALGRTADSAGKAFWVQALANGTSRADVAVSFALSSENVAQTKAALASGVFAPDQDAADVARLYHGILERDPDIGGLAFYSAASNGNVPLSAIARTMLSSPEYASHFGVETNAAFVDHLYVGALGRGSAGDGGASFWVNALNSGAARADVAVGISESPEAQRHHLSDIELGYHLA